MTYKIRAGINRNKSIYFSIRRGETPHLLPTSAKANEWTVLQVTFLGKRRCASLATDLLKATYRKRRCGRCSAYFTNVVVFPVPADGQHGPLSYTRHTTRSSTDTKLIFLLQRLNGCTSPNAALTTSEPVMLKHLFLNLSADMQQKDHSQCLIKMRKKVLKPQWFLHPDVTAAGPSKGTGFKMKQQICCV